MPVANTPVTSISWGTSVTDYTVTVYFVPSGDTVGGYTSEGASAYEIAQFEAVFSVVASVTNLTFTTVNDPNADFQIVMDDDEVLGEFDGEMGPPGEANAGIGIFDGQDILRGPDGPMDAGGYDFMVVTHEFMHALGLSHPHDDGGGSPIMNGVDSAFDDYGDFDLNQGVFTVMTYNNGLFTGSPGSTPDENHIFGYEAGPMALDIAVLQSLYGANMNTAIGDNTYLLPDQNATGTGWQAIWDAGGTDEIAYAGARDVSIDLRAASLQYEAGGGGWVSAADGISGGYTIANGVVIENASGGSGNDGLTGNDADNVLSGFDGDDTLSGGAGSDTLAGGAGSDKLTGGQGADLLTGEGGDDTFLYDSRADAFGDVVIGGNGPDDCLDNDTLNLRGLGPFTVVDRVADPTDTDATKGSVNFLDASGKVEGVLQFSQIETLVICFTPGVMVATLTGEVRVEDLRIGDRVITRDNGVQKIRWIGRKPVSAAKLADLPGLRPIRIRKGALGNNLPERDMQVSPNHRMLIANGKAQLLFGEPEVLIAAKHLLGTPGIDQGSSAGTDYIHILFDRHEVILSNGAWSESFHPGAYALAGIGQAQRAEIFELFPELAESDGVANFRSARKSLKGYEARSIAV